METEKDKEHEDITERPLKNMTNTGKHSYYSTQFIFSPSFASRFTLLLFFPSKYTKCGLAIQLINKS